MIKRTQHGGYTHTTLSLVKRFLIWSQSRIVNSASHTIIPVVEPAKTVGKLTSTEPLLGVSNVYNMQMRPLHALSPYTSPHMSISGRLLVESNRYRSTLSYVALSLFVKG